MYTFSSLGIKQETIYLQKISQRIMASLITELIAMSWVYNYYYYLLLLLLLFIIIIIIIIIQYYYYHHHHCHLYSISQFFSFFIVFGDTSTIVLFTIRIEIKFMYVCIDIEIQEGSI